MDRSTPSLPVHHQLPESTQTHVHQVGDAIQPSHSLSSPSPPALNLSQHQAVFQWVSSSHQEAEVLEFQPQHQSLSFEGLISFRIAWFDLFAVQGTLQSSPTPQFKGINSSTLSLLYGPTLTPIHDYWKNHSLTRQTFVGKVMSLLFNILSRMASRLDAMILVFWMLSFSARNAENIC